MYGAQKWGKREPSAIKGRARGKRGEKKREDAEERNKTQKKPKNFSPVKWGEREGKRIYHERKEGEKTLRLDE